jgi:hypothetical protein
MPFDMEWPFIDLSAVFTPEHPGDGT